MGMDPGRGGGSDGGSVVLVRNGKFVEVNQCAPFISQAERARRMEALVARFSPMRLSDAAIKAEADSLDAITNWLNLPDNWRGRTLQEIARGTGLGIGRVQEVCRKSEACLKVRPRNPRLWFNDWDDIEPEFRPKRSKGRPRTPKMIDPANGKRRTPSNLTNKTP